MAVAVLQKFAEDRKNIFNNAILSKFSTVNKFILNGEGLNKDDDCLHTEKYWSTEIDHQCDMCTQLKVFSHKEKGMLLPNVTELKNLELKVSYVDDSRSMRKAVIMAILIQGFIGNKIPTCNKVLAIARCGLNLTVLHIPSNIIGWSEMQGQTLQNLLKQISVLQRQGFTHPDILLENSVCSDYPNIAGIRNLQLASFIPNATPKKFRSTYQTYEAYRNQLGYGGYTYYVVLLTAGYLHGQSVTTSNVWINVFGINASSFAKKVSEAHIWGHTVVCKILEGYTLKLL